MLFMFSGTDILLFSSFFSIFLRPFLFSFMPPRHKTTVFYYYFRVKTCIRERPETTSL